MRLGTALNYTITALVVILIVLLLAGNMLGQPMFIFVETGSMQPTLAPGDGYIAIPAAVGGEVSAGDVILFEADEVGDGGLTTHRVESVTAEGYITKGDNNPFTDQDGGEPVVTQERIRSVAWQPGGDLVVLPRLGVVAEYVSAALMAVMAPIARASGMGSPDSRSLGIFVLAGGLAVLSLSMFTEGSVRSRIRERSGLLENVFVVIALLAVLVIIPLNIAMLVPSGVYSIEVISSTQPTPDPAVIEAGGSSTVEYLMQNSGFLPIVVFLEPGSPGVDISEEFYRVSPRSTVGTDIVMHAPEETGPHVKMVQEHRYLMVLPPGVIATLHRIHPFVAIVAINMVMIGLVTVITIAVLGRDRDRTRVRDRDISWFDQLFR